MVEFIDRLCQVYSSDLPRAKRTAEIINAILDEREPVREISLLRERSFGIFEGKTRDEVIKDFPSQYTAFQKFDLVRTTSAHTGTYTDALTNKTAIKMVQTREAVTITLSLRVNAAGLRSGRRRVSPSGAGPSDAGPGAGATLPHLLSHHLLPLKKVSCFIQTIKCRDC